MHTTKVNAGKGSLLMASHLQFHIAQPKTLSTGTISSMHYKCTGLWETTNKFLSPVFHFLTYSCFTQSNITCSIYKVFQVLTECYKLSQCLQQPRTSIAWLFIFRSLKLFLYSWRIFHSDTSVSTGWRFCQFSRKSNGLENKDLIQRSKYLQTS